MKTVNVAVLILSAVMAFNSRADQDFCSTAGRFGESIYLMKDSTDTERQSYINYGLSLNSGFLSLSETEREVLSRYLMSINEFVGKTKINIKNPYSFFYRKCTIESMVAIKKIERNLKKCSVIGEFTGYIYDEKNKGRTLNEITSEIEKMKQENHSDPTQPTQNGLLIEMMMNATSAVYKNKSLPRSSVIQEQYRKCLSMT